MVTTEYREARGRARNRTVSARIAAISSLSWTQLQRSPYRSNLRYRLFSRSSLGEGYERRHRPQSGAQFLPALAKALRTLWRCHEEESALSGLPQILRDA